MQALESVRRQTHRNLEIIVVNDGSDDPRYFDKRPDNVVWIDLDPNSRRHLGYPCPGYVKNRGLDVSRGEYIAILDDDDLWLPDKISLQLEAMIAKGLEMCCTEGYMGDGPYDQNRDYPVYHREFYGNFCADFFSERGRRWTGQLPETFSRELIEEHNFVIHSSVLIKRELLDRVGFYREFPLGGVREGGEFRAEDWDLWMRCAAFGDFLHLNTPLVYYDGRLSERKFGRRLVSKLKRIFPGSVTG